MDFFCRCVVFSFHRVGQEMIFHVRQEMRIYRPVIIDPDLVLDGVDESSLENLENLQVF